MLNALFECYDCLKYVPFQRPKVTPRYSENQNGWQPSFECPCIFIECQRVKIKRKLQLFIMIVLRSITAKISFSINLGIGTQFNM